MSQLLAHIIFQYIWIYQMFQYIRFGQWLKKRVPSKPQFWGFVFRIIQLFGGFQSLQAQPYFLGFRNGRNVREFVRVGELLLFTHIGRLVNIWSIHPNIHIIYVFIYVYYIWYYINYIYIYFTHSYMHTTMYFMIYIWPSLTLDVSSTRCP